MGFKNRNIISFSINNTDLMGKKHVYFKVMEEPA